MGCGFSRRGGLRLFKRKENRRGQESTSNLQVAQMIHGRRPKTEEEIENDLRTNQVNIAFLSSYIPEWAPPSTLVFMASDKECFGDWRIVDKGEKMNAEAMIQEEVPLAIEKEEEDDVNEEQAEQTEPIKLPDCLYYEGFHSHGFHLFCMDYKKFNDSVQAMTLDSVFTCIFEGIEKIVKDQRYIVVYRDLKDMDASCYFPNPPACGKELFESLCRRFPDQTLNIVLHHPSWYILTELSLPTEGVPFFSPTVMSKLKITFDDIELARATGFPGEIRALTSPSF